MSLGKLLEKTGQFPGLSLQVIPLNRSARVNGIYGVRIDNFLRYTFRSSIIVPVDSFSCEFAFPDDTVPISQRIRSGDIVQLIANSDKGEEVLSTGIIDRVRTDVSGAGEYVRVMGRDLMSQLDAQSVFSVDGNGIWGGSITPTALFKLLQVGTRISALQLQGIVDSPYPLAMEAGESKLQVLLRYLEPLNALAWMKPNGDLIIGRPDMRTSVAASGRLTMSKSKQDSNCLHMSSDRAEATIPNFILPIWAAQVQAQRMLGQSQGFPNGMPAVARLREQGHRVTKVVVVSEPAGDRRDQANMAATLQAVGLPNLLQAMGLREMARQNMHALEVQAAVPGHLNDDGRPYKVDQTYEINFDRDAVAERMYLYDAEYSLDPKAGPRTVLSFCRMGTIVAGVKYQ